MLEGLCNDYVAPMSAVRGGLLQKRDVKEYDMSKLYADLNPFSSESIFFNHLLATPVEELKHKINCWMRKKDESTGKVPQKDFLIRDDKYNVLKVMAIITRDVYDLAVKIIGKEDSVTVQFASLLSERENKVRQRKSTIQQQVDEMKRIKEKNQAPKQLHVNFHKDIQKTTGKTTRHKNA